MQQEIISKSETMYEQLLLLGEIERSKIKINNCRPVKYDSCLRHTAKVLMYVQNEIKYKLNRKIIIDL